MAKRFESKNEDYGFHGTINGDKNERYHDAVCELKASGITVKNAITLLDSPFGRHIADTLNDPWTGSQHTVLSAVEWNRGPDTDAWLVNLGFHG